MKSIADDDIVLSQIGFPSKELYNAKDRDNNFYMLGALGAATSVAIGLANALPNKHVYVIDGDGSFFFNPNQLSDLATHAPKNLTIICLDNGSWGSTGNQPTLSSQGYNLTAQVQALGIHSTVMTDDTRVLATALKDKVSFLHYMIQAGNDKIGGEIPMKAVEIKDRFMNSVL
jgi:sulfopyruvate decarboxylase subunit beta